jgi:hypothetical protein
VRQERCGSIYFLNVLLASLPALFLIAGCSPSTYSYRALDDNCNCKEYSREDRENRIGYIFSASYTIDKGIITDIEIEFVNNSDEDLHLDAGAVRVSSKNVSYEYNDRFLPLPQLTIAPHKSEHISMTGKDVSAGEDEWNKIAGERLTVTIKELRLGRRILPQQTVEFAPENPKVRGG